MLGEKVNFKSVQFDLWLNWWSGVGWYEDNLFCIPVQPCKWIIHEMTTTANNLNSTQQCLLNRHIVFLCSTKPVFLFSTNSSSFIKEKQICFKSRLFFRFFSFTKLCRASQNDWGGNQLSVLSHSPNTSYSKLLVSQLTVLCTLSASTVYAYPCQTETESERKITKLLRTIPSYLWRR